MQRSELDKLLTVYGRKPVLEALRDNSLNCHTLHLADSNRPAGILSEIEALATSRSLPVRFHPRRELSHISRNAKQDQGVALDILCPDFRSVDDYLQSSDDSAQRRLLALDGVTNPQNLGMIIRSVTAGNIDGLILPRRGNAALGPLVIKASAGTVFRAPVLHCDALNPALTACKAAGASICILDGTAPESLFRRTAEPFAVYVLGSESEGVSAATRELADRQLHIPMRNGVESLNVAVAASLIAFAPTMTEAY
ncbi:MAG: RNA methyltransferase [Halioglobus sp.]